MKRLLIAALCGASAWFAANAHAQTFPNRPIRLIVPFGPGPTDTQFRKLAEVASRHLGQPIVVENRPGAGGTVGPVQMARTEKPDGYTLSASFITLVRQPHLQKVDWDPIRDFTWIMGLAGYTFVFSVRADSPLRHFREVIDFARKHPDKMSVGTPGTGTTLHLLLEALAMRTGAQFTHVAFKSGGEATQNLLGGHVMATNDVAGSVLGQVQGGKVRILLSFDEQRQPWIADVPTARELGYDLAYSSPFGLVGPAGMPASVVQTLHDAFLKALDDPDNQKLMTELRHNRWYRGPKEYTEWARQQFVLERAFVERAGLLAK